MILKIIGLGLIGYLQNKINVFDAIVVLVSIIELILEY